MKLPLYWSNTPYYVIWDWRKIDMWCERTQKVNIWFKRPEFAHMKGFGNYFSKELPFPDRFPKLEVKAIPLSNPKRSWTGKLTIPLNERKLLEKGVRTPYWVMLNNTTLSYPVYIKGIYTSPFSYLYPYTRKSYLVPKRTKKFNLVRADAVYRAMKYLSLNKNYFKGNPIRVIPCKFLSNSNSPLYLKPLKR